MMKRAIFTSIWVGLVFYTLILFFYGPKGYFSTKTLEKNIFSMEKNIESLELQYFGLDTRWNALRKSPLAIAIDARNAGFLADDEILLRLDMNLEKTPALPGVIIAPEIPSGLNPQKAALWSLILALGLFVILGGVAILRTSIKNIVE